MPDVSLLKIAVIGGGIYGTTIAIRLAKKYHVDLYESNSDILKGASQVNQFRLHRGYHYPRSAKTIISSLRSSTAFMEEYRNTVIDNYKHYYCIAKEGSKTSPEEFINVCDTFKLEYQQEFSPVVSKDSIGLSLRVREYLIDYNALYRTVWERLKKSGVDVKLNTTATKETLEKYDYSVICTYGNINTLIPEEEDAENYQYELVEKIAVSLPPIFDKQSVVIMDGPFTCVDPYGNTSKHLMGNVVHAIHQTNVGKYPVYDKKFDKLINNGFIENPPITNYRKFIESAEKFFPEITKAKHLASMYTFRTVLPNKDRTDERPTIVKELSQGTVMVFSGKIASCVTAARKIEEIVNSKFKNKKSNVAEFSFV